jgi:hypothetical protein
MIRDSLYALDNIGFSFLNSMKGMDYSLAAKVAATLFWLRHQQQRM